MRRASSRGFSYVEVIVALFIVSALVASLGTLVRGLPLTRHIQHQDLALKIAKHQLESVRAGGYGSVPESGPFSDTQLSSLPSGTGALTVSDFNTETKQVTVTVSWKEPNTATSSLALDTLITEIGGL